MRLELTNEQRVRIKDYIEAFKLYSKTEDFKEDTEDRKRRERFFNKLTEDRIRILTEIEFGEIISKLWASQIWGNKDYLIQKILDDNGGVEKIREELYDLFYGQETIEKRYEKFLNNIKGLGPSSVTELLCFFKPNEAGIWNDLARKALKTLGFSVTIPVNKYKITGEEYMKFNNILKLISQELVSQGFKDSNLLFVDYFLYEVWHKPKREEEIKEYPIEFDHEEIIDKIRNIGSLLGFETETEKTVGHGACVDVVWRAKIANLGLVRYIFEVHKRGSIDSLILNLQKAKRNPTVQKIIAVSDNKQLEKIQKEIIGLPEDFRNSFSIWDVQEVQKTHQALSEVIRTIEKLELVRSEFEIS